MIFLNVVLLYFEKQLRDDAEPNRTTQTETNELQNKTKFSFIVCEMKSNLMAKVFDSTLKTARGYFISPENDLKR